MPKQSKDVRVSLRAFSIGVLFAALFSAVSVYVENDRRVYLTATQVPVLPFALLFLSVLLVNPVCRLLRFVRPFNAAEILIVFIMGLVSAGIATFGLTGPLVPTVAGLFNPSWNHDQTAWNRHVAPHLNEAYFLSEAGIQAAATDYAQRYEQQRHLRRIVETAERDRSAQDRLTELEGAWERTQAATGHSQAPDDLAAAEQAARHLRAARDAAQRARQAWEALREEHPDLSDAPTTIEQLTPRLQTAEAALQSARERLRELEQKAFEKVQLFRRGLPQPLRAYPGFVKLPEDTTGSYLARWRRVWDGHGATRDAREAQALIESGFDEAPLDELHPWLQSLQRRLARMSETASLRAELDELIDKLEALNRDIVVREESMRALHRLRREALRPDQRALERRIAREQRAFRSLNRQRLRVSETRDVLQRQWEAMGLATELEQQVATLATAVHAGTLPSDARATLQSVIANLPSVEGSVRRFLVGDVPWRDWFGPLWRWALAIALTYMVLMTFNVLIFRQWAHNEKLIYPLAELPMLLVGEENAPGAIPDIFRGGLFWVGFAISGTVLGYNALAATEWIPGVEPLVLRHVWTDYLHNTAFEGLLHGRMSRSDVFFTMIGLSFLIPKKVSFSMWLFAVLSMLQILVLVNLGYGDNELSFPSELWFTMNFRFAQGGGALLVFSAVVLYKCRHYLLCAFHPSLLHDLPDDERRELRLSSVGFVSGSLGVILVLWLGMGVHPVYALTAYLLIMMITIGLIRAVAEGGILGFQCYTNPFHFLRTLFGFNRTWTSSALFAPLFVYYAVLFLDVKAFIAPAMANSLKIRDSLRIRRRQFHLAVFTAIVVAAVVAVTFSIMMAYARGADLMGHWFYSRLPRIMFDHLADMQRAPLEASAAQTGWIMAGALGMAGLLFFRQTVFWLPHPIGMLMLTNPTMGAYWFSIMLGWLAKSLVTKYGNKNSYTQARKLFVGLIVGELLVVALAAILTLTLDVSIPIDLNR